MDSRRGRGPHGAGAEQPEEWRLAFVGDNCEAAAGVVGLLALERNARPECDEEKGSTMKSGFCGVTAMGNKWVTQITYSGKQHYLGIYSTKLEAALA